MGRVENSVAARRGALAVGLLLGAGVAVALGVYGRVHVPTYEGLPSFGFSSTATFKAWVGSVVLALAAAQASIHAFASASVAAALPSMNAHKQ